MKEYWPNEKKGSNHNVYLCKKHPVLHLRHQVGKTYLRVLFFTHLNWFARFVECACAIARVFRQGLFDASVMMSAHVLATFYTAVSNRHGLHI